MIRFHGTPITPNHVAICILTGRAAMISWERPDQIELAAEVCHSFALDNGAFSAWKRGANTDWPGYYAWAENWSRHPGFAWALIPDVIDGDEEQNDDLIAQCPLTPRLAVPVWHLHESLQRLERLASNWPRIALGSSGEFRMPGSAKWYRRMYEAFDVLCDHEGFPLVKVHGLRMMDTVLFSHFPFSSVDSTNVARNHGLDDRWQGPLRIASREIRAQVLADRIERHVACSRFDRTHAPASQANLELIG